MDTILAVTQETTLQARLVAIPHEVLFEDCLSAQVKITLQQLAALAEDNPRHITPPLTFPRLAGLTRRSAATLRVHLAILRAYRSAVRLQHAGRGCFTLVLADWLFLPLPGHPEEQISHHVPEAIPPALTGQIIPAGWPTSPGPAGSLSVGPQTGINSLPVETTLPERNETPTVDDINILINHINQEEEVDPVKKTTESLPPPNNNNINTPITGAEPAVSPARIKDQAGPTPALPKTGSKASGVGPRQATVQRSPGGRHARHPTENHAPPSKKAGVKDNAISPASPLTLAVRQALEDSGVFSSLFSEVSRAGWSDEELLALVAWCRADNPKKPGGLFMVRLRSGLNPPESYYYPPCPNCGGTGGEHASDCSQRYISGPYASFVKH